MALALLAILGTCGSDGPTTPTPPPTSCAYTVSTTLVTVTASGGIASMTVTTTADCSWTAVADRAWVTVTAGASGVGAGTVTLSIAPSTDTSVRTGTVTVAGHAVTVRQDAVVPCAWALVPDGASVSHDLHTGTFEVRTTASCAWTAAADASWITVNEGQTATGSGTVRFQIDANWAAPRTGIVMVRWPTATAGQNLRVLQAGCSYAVSTPTISLTSAAGTGRFDVYQQSDPIGCGGPLQNACQWTATTNVTWITVSTSVPQTGDNPVSFTVSANPDTSPRTGAITVRDKTVIITQTGR